MEVPPYSEDMDATQTTRRDTINRALALLDSTDPATLAGWLAQTDIHAPLKANPGALRQRMADTVADGSLGNFGAWKAAQQILRAAGQSY